MHESQSLGNVEPALGLGQCQG